MNKNMIITIVAIVVVLLGTILVLNMNNNKSTTTNKIEATILSIGEGSLTVKDENDGVYTFKGDSSDLTVGSRVVIEYSGLLNRDAEVKDIKLVEMKDLEEKDGLGETISDEWLDNGLFSKYYTLAFNKLKKMTLDEKINQLLLVRYPDSNQVQVMKEKQFGGYVLFGKDFTDKTKTEVKKMIDDFQKVSKIPSLTAVDEEGGTVVRISSNPNLRSSRFKSPSALYSEGGLDLIKNDTIEKSNLLNSLGINLNLAPVVDVSTNSGDYMYSRSLQQNSDITSNFAKTVINASKGTGVSYTLKHFPGYGNNADTHTGSSTDSRSYESILKNDIPPFEAGIDAGAEAILVSHNVVTNIDKDNPASLSPTIHNLLRDELNFTGVIITDDLDMGAVSKIDNASVKAILAGNDLIITTDYNKSINEIKKALSDGTLKEDDINKLAFRVIAWKYYKGLIYENQK